MKRKMTGSTEGLAVCDLLRQRTMGCLRTWRAVALLGREEAERMTGPLLTNVVDFSEPGRFDRTWLVACARAKEARNKTRPKNLKMIEGDADATHARLSPLLASLLERARAIHHAAAAEPSSSARETAARLFKLSANSGETKLAKGAGPCTSSFVLSHFAPSLVPFYCQKQWEELALAVPALRLAKDCKFNEAQGAVFYECVLELVTIINENADALPDEGPESPATEENAGGAMEKITPLDVSNALWYARVKGPEVESKIWKEDAPNKKRKEGVNQNDNAVDK
ncbi:hypothetical protein BC830DRAFT_1157566 [Chytriomyces sp. MP71]|nr:hypothetical protein BC830DRAFT_1157566 [Chytriomyces sp. MP71]